MSLDESQSPPQPPPVFTATPSSIIEDTRRLVEQSREVQRRIVENVEPSSATFSNVLLPIAHSENATAAKSHILVFYRFVSTDPELREASRKAQNLWDEFSVETAMNEGLFKLVHAVLEKHEELDPESLHLLKKKYKSHVKNGLNLPIGPLRDRFKTIQSRLSQLTTEFRENLAETGAVWFSPDELEGVPESALSRFEKGQGENQGRLRVTFRPPDFYPVMRHAISEQTRRHLFISNDNQCNQNVPIFREAVILRDEAARLLGYSNHAAFRIEDKMAKTPETVDKFLKDLQLRLEEGGRLEVGRLKELKKKDVQSRGQTFDGQIYVWDNSYYHRLMLEKQYSVDHQKIAEYFSVQTTVAGMFKIVQHLFGLQFRQLHVDGRNTWHPDVQVFSAWNTEELGGTFAGYLYLDLFSRDGKITNAANFNMVPGFVKEDGTRQYPTTALVCNFPKPSSESPSLLRHDEVVTLFHELGHAIHDLVAKVSYACFHGTETVVDFGEAPSQMIEYWCWIPSQLKALSRHYSSVSEEHLAFWRNKNGAQNILPPEQIPDHLVDSLVKAKHVNEASAYLNQLCIGIFDMAIHKPETHAAIEEMNISAAFNKIRNDILPLDSPETLGLGEEWGHTQTRLTHLMGEYDAGYYGYLFSKVFAADMFYTVFGGNPMDRKEGIRYRHALLERGGSQDEMVTLTEFLGRKPETEPFYEELGLA
ncbi:thimet oligopeptidase [Dactylonectria estremocensis]|uniref:Thimet oligopeptidase n=1 Tax=Dactylonectria estremocensis TaxID=1079267 RepID=A0A9P9F0W3_9HYPO|nr:thimet oligopeptidase [Dactylonectria estremocensis]